MARVITNTVIRNRVHSQTPPPPSHSGPPFILQVIAAFVNLLMHIQLVDNVTFSEIEWAHTLKKS